MRKALPELNATHNIVILTGAGISQESGIKTFRDGDGLWENHRIEDVATPEAFRRNPALVQQFYNLRRRQLSEVAPNAAHLALCELEKRWKGEFLLVTQNVDDLHERAGSKNLVHMHGALKEARCLKSGQIHGWEGDIDNAAICHCCGKENHLRPNIVWFGEIPFHMDRILRRISACDYFVAIGTSGLVYPAAGFVAEARMAGAETIEMNMEPSGSRDFGFGLYGKATLTVPELIKHIR